MLEKKKKVEDLIIHQQYLIQVKKLQGSAYEISNPQLLSHVDLDEIWLLAI